MDQPLGVEDQIVAALRRIMRAVDLHSRYLSAEFGLTAPQILVLGAIGRLGKGPIGEVARQVHLSQPTVTGIVDRLEHRGLVDRTKDGADRRTVNVALTTEGRALVTVSPSLLQERFRTALGTLHDWEASMMLGTLQRIATMMEAGTLSAAPLLDTGPVDSGHATAANSEGAASGVEWTESVTTMRQSQDDNQTRKR